MTRIAPSTLPGWADDDHAEALLAYLGTAEADDPAHGIAPGEAKGFFERGFEAEGLAESGLLTGYFEPIYEGAPARGDGFSTPVHSMPEGWEPGAGFASRREILEQGLMDGHELAWLRSPLDAFLLQVQGSGRVRMRDGSERRLGYAGKNGHRYVSLGKLLVGSGELPAGGASMQAIRAWYEKDPVRGDGYLMQNPSYVFFRRFDDLPADKGPIGTSGVPLTAQRSIAVDPAQTELGSLVYIVPTPGGPRPRLCVAQDTGGAIKGPGRTDLFCGTGDAAGEQAGRLHMKTGFFRLVPKAAR